MSKEAARVELVITADRQELLDMLSSNAKVQQLIDEINDYISGGTINGAEGLSWTISMVKRTCRRCGLVSSVNSECCEVDGIFYCPPCTQKLALVVDEMKRFKDKLDSCLGYETSNETAAEYFDALLKLAKSQ